MAQSSPLLTVLFRASVVIACAALLLGVAGVFYFREREPPDLAGLAVEPAAVTLDAPGDGEGLEVVVRWATDDGEPQEERGRPSREAATWLFDRAPLSVPVDLVVFQTTTGRRREVHRTQAVLMSGALFQAVLPR